MNPDIVAVNNDKINNLILQLDNSEQAIRRILNDIAEEYSTINSNISYQGSQTYAVKKRVIYEMINVISDNIETYKEDLLTAKKKFRNAETKATNDFQRATRQIDVGKQYKSKQEELWKY